MSCDGLYLISLKGRQPQRLLTRERLRGACPLLYPPPFFPRAKPNGQHGMESLAMQSILLGEVDDPRRAPGSRIRTACTHDRDRQRLRPTDTHALSAATAAAAAGPEAGAWHGKKIRQPKKPFPSLPCFWSGRRAWNGLFEPIDFQPKFFVLSFSLQPLLIIHSFFIMPSGRNSLLSLHSRLTVIPLHRPGL